MVPGGRYYLRQANEPNSHNLEQIHDLPEAPEENANVTVNSSKINPLKIKANLV